MVVNTEVATRGKTTKCRLEQFRILVIHDTLNVNEIVENVAVVVAFVGIPHIVDKRVRVPICCVLTAPLQHLAICTITNLGDRSSADRALSLSIFALIST